MDRKERKKEEGRRLKQREVCYLKKERREGMKKWSLQ